MKHLEDNPFESLQNMATIVIHARPSKKIDKSWEDSCKALNEFGHKAQKILERMADQDREAAKKIIFR